jgi:surface protein
MFHNCWSLNSFPNISNWNIFNVKNMSHMFHNCWSLKNIPGIEKWDLSNASNMSFMFHNCPIDFNEIKKWNISKLQNSYQMFYNFNNYNLDDIKDMININFYGPNCLVTCIFVNRDMLIEDLIDKYLQKSRIFKGESLLFLYDGIPLNKNLRLNEIIESNKINLTITVYDIYGGVLGG